LISIVDLGFRFPKSDFQLAVSALDVADGDRVAIVGPSGSGKTTLLHLIAGILVPTHGTIRVANQTVGSLGDAARRALSVTRIGLVFQSFELVSYLDVFENILLPYRLNPALSLTSGTSQRVEQLAAETGIAHRLRYFPHRLSHGEKQRVAICRAMLPEPPLLLADEPTGNLDSRTSNEILNMFSELNESEGLTVILVTHDPGVAHHAKRVIHIRDGLIENGAYAAPVSA
jgi:ABC-type lipoprotein export system ATPase subunit